MEKEILELARRIQAISQTGMRFTKDNFDKQRFEELREISAGESGTEVGFKEVELGNKDCQRLD